MYSLNTWPLLAFSLSRYSWKTTEWTECRVDPLLSQQDKRRGNQTALCGGGVQTREVYCVQANENLLSQLNTHKDKEGNLVFFSSTHLWRAGLGSSCRGIYAAIWGHEELYIVHIMADINYGEW